MSMPAYFQWLSYWKIHPVLLIIWIPESVDTRPLIYPICKAKVASSNAFYIYPGPKKSRSPPYWDEPHSLISNAICSKSSGFYFKC